MIARNLYRGYSSKEFRHKKQFRLNDFDLVRQDLLNHLYTRKGERVMMPQFGTRLPDMLFEPLDEDTVDVVRQDITAVIEFDPRVRALDLQIIPDYDNGSINVLADLYYVELNMSNRLTLNLVFGDSQ